MNSTPPPRPAPAASPVFATTHWTVILQAQHESQPGSASALDRLCRNYWYPLYAYLRRRGHAHPDAEDLIQGFFKHLLDRRTLLKADRAKGRFRSFLLASLNYYVADDRDRRLTQKRGGGQQPLSLDEPDADGRYRLEPADPDTPESLFERRWALAILDQVLARLEEEYRANGNASRFETLRPFLAGERTHGSYADLATRLGTSEGAIKMSVLRLRSRYRELFREIIAETVEAPEEVDDELHYLTAVIAR